MLGCKLTLAFLSLALVSCVASEKIIYKDCGSKSGQVGEVRVIPCPQEPCQFKRNSTMKIEIDFKSAVNTKTTKAVLHGIIGGVPVPFPLPNDDGCKSGVKCPVTTGDVNTFAFGMPVREEYPTLKVVVKIELQDDNGNDLVCILFPAEITD